MTKEEIQSCIDHIDRIWENLKERQNKASQVNEPAIRLQLMQLHKERQDLQNLLKESL